MPFNEVDPGPFEIRLKTSSHDDRVGYAWYEPVSSGSQQAYFVVQENVEFPLPYGPDVIFRPHAMSKVGNPDDFYDWVVESGGLEGEIESYEITESYQSWK